MAKSAIFSHKFSKYSGNSSHSKHNFNKSSVLARENAQYFLTNFCIYMWDYQVKNVKLQATTKLFIVAIFYQINPIQNTTNITEITKNSLNLVPHTNLKIGEKFSLIVVIAIQHNLTLPTLFSYCCKSSHRY